MRKPVDKLAVLDKWVRRWYKQNEKYMDSSWWCNDEDGHYDMGKSAALKMVMLKIKKMRGCELPLPKGRSF